MMKLLKGAAVFAAGAAVAYLFDPVSGRGRRARLADQAGARARDAAEKVRKRADYAGGQMRGAAHEVFQRQDDEPADDAELLQKIRSEAIGPSGIPTGGFEVHVAGGLVFLRGEITQDADIDDLVRRIRGVTGVTGVKTELERV